MSLLIEIKENPDDLARADATAAYSAFKPPKRVTVAEGAADTLIIRQNGGYNGPWSADETPYMVEPMNMLASRKHEAVCFVGPARTGKACCVTTPIPTPQGWTTMGDIQVGDTVLGPDGKATRVLYVSEVRQGRPCYRVTFSDGESIVCDDEHLWGVERFYWREPHWRYEVLTTNEIRQDLLLQNNPKNGKKRYRYRVSNTKPVELPDASLPIDPYLLGEEIANTGESIPESYLRASVHQRWSLFQGLLQRGTAYDSENENAVQFNTTSTALKDSLLELARSLGISPVCEYDTAWVIKLCVPSELGLATHRQIIEITPVDSVPVKCIEVDNSSKLYIAGKGWIPTHNTLGLLDAWMAHVVVCDPGDFLITHMTQEKAREFSKTRIDRAIRYSPKLLEMIGIAQDNNIHDKQFKNGMFLRVGWPTVSQLSGSDYRYVALTDYDRMPDNIDGEGSPFGLALKRTQTFMSRGMCMLESSPGRDITDPNWTQSTNHEAPPTGGIMAIYNRGDRRMYYWQCPHCGDWFCAKPGLDLFHLPDDDVLLEMVREANLDAMASEYARIVCPNCGCLIEDKYKHVMNRTGVWLADGEVMLPDGTRGGDPQRSNIASYWLGGVAAAYQSWKSLILRYLQGLREYAMTGLEENIKTTINTDQGAPYMSRALLTAAKNSVDPLSRKNDDLARYYVPDQARFLVAAVDVQGGSNARFIVQVHAIGQDLEQWVVDRYAITESNREGTDGGKAPIDPAGYPEDWDVLTERVVLSTYRTSHPDSELRVRLVVCDTGGEDGVTEKAYEWWRRVRENGHMSRVMLIRGSPSRYAPLIRESFVGATRRKEQGDVPLYSLNTNLFKDAIHNNLKRRIPGPGYMHLPGWLPRSFFDELKAEVRNADGTWSQVKARNESLDLSCYIYAGVIRLGADRFDWRAPPAWAKPIFEGNSDLITSEDRRELKSEPQRPIRRTNKSSYV